MELDVLPESVLPDELSLEPPVPLTPGRLVTVLAICVGSLAGLDAVLSLLVELTSEAAVGSDDALDKLPDTPFCTSFAILSPRVGVLGLPSSIRPAFSRLFVTAPLILVPRFCSSESVEMVKFVVTVIGVTDGPLTLV